MAHLPNSIASHHNRQKEVTVAIWTLSPSFEVRIAVSWSPAVGHGFSREPLDFVPKLIFDEIQQTKLAEHIEFVDLLADRANQTAGNSVVEAHFFFSC